MSRRTVLVAVGVGAFVVCLAYEFVGVPLIVDNQHYFFMSERAAHGVPPHVSNFDPKTMLSMLVTGAGIWTGGWLGLDAVLASRIVSWLVFAATTALVAAIVIDVTGDRRAGLLGGLVLVSMRWMGLMSAVGSRPKVFLCLFIAVMVYGLHHRRWSLAAGGATAAFLTWQPAVLLLPVLLVFVVRDGGWRGTWKTVGVATGGVIAYELYFFLSGGLDEQITQSLLFPLRYQPAGFSGPLAELRSFRDLWRTGYGSEAVVIVAGAAWIWIVVRLVRERSGLRERRTEVAISLLTAIVFAFTLYDHQGRSDLLFVAPFVALLIGLGASELLRRLQGGRAGWALTVAASAVLVAVTAFDVSTDRYPYTIRDQRTAASAVGDLLGSGTSVYAVGSSHLLGMNHANNWTPFSYFFRGVPEYLADTGRLEDATGSGVPTFVPANQGTLPDVVLVDRSWPPGWPAWLEARYRNVPSELFEQQGISVWERRPGTYVPVAEGP